MHKLLILCWVFAQNVVAALFKGYALASDDFATCVRYALRTDGRPNGDGYVVFSTEEEVLSHAGFLSTCFRLL